MSAPAPNHRPPVHDCACGHPAPAHWKVGGTRPFRGACTTCRCDLFQIDRPMWRGDGPQPSWWSATQQPTTLTDPSHEPTRRTS